MGTGRLTWMTGCRGLIFQKVLIVPYSTKYLCASQTVQFSLSSRRRVLRGPLSPARAGVVREALVEDQSLLLTLL